MDLTRQDDWTDASLDLIDRYIAVRIRAELALGGEGFLTDSINSPVQWDLERAGRTVVDGVLTSWEPLRHRSRARTSRARAGSSVQWVRSGK